MVVCCSINMRIFKAAELVFLLLAIVRSASLAPLESSPNPAIVSNAGDNEEPSTTSKPEPQIVGDHYDQRQNGTENYRIHVDGLVFVVAPIEGLLLAGGLSGLEDSGVFGTTDSIIQKPKPDVPPAPELATTASPEKPSSSANAKSSHGASLRLMNLLTPFLRRTHHVRQ